MTEKKSHNYIKEWIEYRGLSYRRLEGRLEVSPGGDPLLSYNSLRRIANGEQAFDDEKLHAIATALGVSVADLFSINPLAEGKVVDAIDAFKKLDADQQKQALDYIQFLAKKESA